MRQVILEPQVLKVFKEKLVPLEQPVLTGKTELMEMTVLRVRLERQVKLELKVFKV